MLRFVFVFAFLSSVLVGCGDSAMPDDMSASSPVDAGND